MSKDATKWTNQSLRAHLGERGFIPNEKPLLIDGENVTYTTFTRDDEDVVLAEYADSLNRGPQLYHDGWQLDPMTIGYRNEQIQHDKMRGD